MGLCTAVHFLPSLCCKLASEKAKLIRRRSACELGFLELKDQQQQVSFLKVDL
jgi:hypothetical protein